MLVAQQIHPSCPDQRLSSALSFNPNDTRVAGEGFVMYIRDSSPAPLLVFISKVGIYCITLGFHLFGQ